MEYDAWYPNTFSRPNSQQFDGAVPVTNGFTTMCTDKLWKKIELNEMNMWHSNISRNRFSNRISTRNYPKMKVFHVQLPTARQYLLTLQNIHHFIHSIILDATKPFMMMQTCQFRFLWILPLEHTWTSHFLVILIISLNLHVEQTI